MRIYSTVCKVVGSSTVVSAVNESTTTSLDAHICMLRWLVIIPRDAQFSSAGAGM